MSNDLIHVLVFDRSLSTETSKLHEEFVRNLHAKTGVSDVILFQNNEIKHVRYGDLEDKHFLCCGGTPLLDAIRQAIELDPDQLTILTDGEENMSRFTTLCQVQELINELKLKKKLVTFVGAGLKEDVGTRMGIHRNTCIRVNAERQSTVDSCVDALADLHTQYLSTSDEVPSFTQMHRANSQGPTDPPQTQRMKRAHTMK